MLSASVTSQPMKTPRSQKRLFRVIFDHSPANVVENKQFDVKIIFTRSFSKKVLIMA